MHELSKYTQSPDAVRSSGMMTVSPEDLIDPAILLPPPFVIVRLFLEDGAVESGAWTGNLWWVRGREVQPWRWQAMHGPLLAMDADRRGLDAA